MSRSESLYNEEIEQGLLGILLTSPEKLDEISWFDVTWFNKPVHGRIFTIIHDAWKTGRAASAAFVAQYFEKDPDLDAADGSQYIYDLADNVISVTQAVHYAEHIRALYTRRMLLKLSGRIKAAVTDPEPDMTTEKIFSGIEKFLLETKANKRADAAIPVASSVMDAIKDAKNPMAGVPTGIPALDRLTGGLKKGCLYVLAGRPGMGKTALGTTIAVNVAAREATLFFSLEMTHTELSKRILSRYSRQAVHSGNVHDWAAVDAAAAAVTGLALSIDDAAGLTATDILARARMHKKRYGLSLIVIDYLGLIMPENRKLDKVHQIGEISLAMKNMAKELDVPVLLLSQLSRALEQRDDKRPQLSDLRDSGNIEQDADAVIFVYREEYYLARAKAPKNEGFVSNKMREIAAEKTADMEAVKGVAEVIVAKQRQGPVGTVMCKFDGVGQVFYE